MQLHPIEEDAVDVAVVKIHGFLDAIQTTNSVRGKVVLTRKLYQYMMTVPTLLSHPRFRQTTIMKMNEVRAGPYAAPLFRTFTHFERFIENLNRNQ
jgi:hypothetical protein